MSQMENDLQQRVENLEKGTAVAEATQMTAHAGMAASVTAGAAGLVAGMIIGLLIGVVARA